MAKWRRRTNAKNAPAPAVAEFDLRRFIKLCAMLESPNEGERAAAALKASDMLKASGLHWRDVVKDHTALLETIANGGSDDAEAQARRFWKSKTSTPSQRDQI